MLATLMSFLTSVDYGLHDPLLSRLKASKRAPWLLLGLGLLILGSTAAYAVAAKDAMPNCQGEQVVLAYPRYSSKGLVDEYAYRCGVPNRSCRLRGHTAKGPVYDCSPFALGGRNGIL